MSLLTSLVAHTTGGAQFDFVQNFQPVGGSSTVLVGNTAYFSLIRVGRPLTVAAMKWNSTVSSGNVNAGIFHSLDGGTTLKPLSITGSTAMAGTAVIQSVALAAPVTLQPGKDYWLALAASDGATATFYRQGIFGNVGAIGSQMVLKASSFALNADITGHSGAGIMPWIGATAS